MATERYAKNRLLVDIISDALDGGVDILQMREKNKSKEELIRLGNELSLLCRKRNKIFIVNDDPMLAKEINADGVHMGQEDFKKIPLQKARNLIGRGKIIGISTHSFEQFKSANASDADYIAFGPIFDTPTKNYFLGTSQIKSIMQITQKPVFFIGGINLSNIDKVLSEGAKNIALIRGILEARDAKKAVSAFKERIDDSRPSKTK